ncbi:MAG TPA: hypothetical protein ENJ50_09700, partial [Planctomycetaceae bacterium]|nr:hypothetical protein [Planctomycetaceae bacterium]
MFRKLIHLLKSTNTRMASSERFSSVPLRSRRGAGRFPWEDLSDEELLDWRFCDLGLQIEGTVLEERIAKLYRELSTKGLHFKPHCWLSDEWFSPDGIPGIAIPFYLAHPRLARLEYRQMYEVEGGTQRWC